MSYCRNNGEDSDVYVIASMSGNLECFGAGWRLEGESPVHDKIWADSYDSVNGKIVKTGKKHQAEASFYTKSRKALIEHLMLHRDAGHMVPQRAIDRLRNEIETIGDEYA